MQIPAVRELAEANEYYREELRDGFDLRTLAQDYESSMTSLNSGEKRQLALARDHYGIQIRSLGIPEIIEALRFFLKQRYLEKPAYIITEDAKYISLPFDWCEFESIAQTFSAETKEKALKAYYQHLDHTAFRYLMKPNPWINQLSPYVYRNQEGAWSTFEAYQNLIALHFLAAKDETVPAIDGYTIETRIEQFIQELALIARAHNWDQSRLNTSSNQVEEYDDLEADYPSCYSGVKRRLFQSVLGHPLFKRVSLNDIKLELRDFVRNHFINLVNDSNCEAFLEGYTDPFSKQGVLKSFDIPKKSQQQFFNYLANKYGAQFESDITFKLYIEKRFQIADSDSHAARFGGEIDLLKLITQKIEQSASNEVISEVMKPR